MFFWLLLCAYCVAGIYGSDVAWHNSRSFVSSEAIPNQKVFILTMPRSGSTFVGEIFLQNPGFTYLFEPMRGISEGFANDSCSATPSDHDITRIMKAIYNCDFSTLKRYTEDHSWKGHMYSWDRIASFSGKNKTKLCLPPSSSSPESHNISVAVKEIEMWAPKLDWLQNTIGSDLRVIWLVRDVRGFVSSWLVDGTKENFFRDWGYDQMNLWARYSKCEIAKCSGMLNETQVARIREILSNKSSAPHLKMAAWWTIDNAITHYYFSRFKGKALLVKYEDLASQPFEITQQIYAFLGRPRVHEKVLRYLVWATKGGDVGNRYDTYRNSYQMAAVWRSRLSPTQIQDIQEIAGVWFPFFGYDA